MTHFSLCHRSGTAPLPAVPWGRWHPNPKSAWGHQKVMGTPRHGQPGSPYTARAAPNLPQQPQILGLGHCCSGAVTPPGPRSPRPHSPGGISSSAAPFPWENPNPTAPSPQDAWTHSSPCPMGILRCLVPGLSPAQPLGEVRPIWGFFALPNIQAAKNLGELISLSPLRALGAP